MIWNEVECVTGIFIHHDIVQGISAQSDKKWVGVDLSLPWKDSIKDHTAEVLHQCKVTKLNEGIWAGGDAWFGSAPSLGCILPW